jgi:hypothetical protein
MYDQQPYYEAKINALTFGSVHFQPSRPYGVSGHAG